MPQYGPVPGGRDFLGKIADGGGFGSTHLARVHLHVADEDAPEGRLAGAIRTDQADPLAARDVPGEVPENGLGPEGFAGLFDLDHDSCARSVRRSPRGGWVS